jgi:cell division protein FtsW (lipid II flippase)
MGKTFSRRGSQRRRDNRLSPVRAYLRIVSNIGLIFGQIVLLFASRDFGLAVIICSSLLSVPFFLKEGLWDVLILIAFMQVINFVGLFVT